MADESIRAWKLFTISRRLFFKSVSFTSGRESAVSTGIPALVNSFGRSWLTSTSFWYGREASTTANFPSRLTISSTASPPRFNTLSKVSWAASPAPMAASVSSSGTPKVSAI